MIISKIWEIFSFLIYEKLKKEKMPKNVEEFSSEKVTLKVIYVHLFNSSWTGFKQ